MAFGILTANGMYEKARSEGNTEKEASAWVAQLGHGRDEIPRLYLR